jgi:hypothetical protein
LDHFLGKEPLAASRMAILVLEGRHYGFKQKAYRPDDRLSRGMVSPFQQFQIQNWVTAMLGQFPSHPP